MKPLVASLLELKGHLFWESTLFCYYWEVSQTTLHCTYFHWKKIKHTSNIELLLIDLVVLHLAQYHSFPSWFFNVDLSPIGVSHFEQKHCLLKTPWSKQKSTHFSLEEVCSHISLILGGISLAFASAIVGFKIKCTLISNQLIGQRTKAWPNPIMTKGISLLLRMASRCYG